MDFNLADLFECVADHVPDRTAVASGGRRITYAALDERATRLAHALAARGVGPGDHVGCYLPNCPEYLETMFAAYKLRAVPVNINYRYAADELAYLFGDAGLVAVVAATEYADLLDTVQPRVASLHTCITVGTGAASDYHQLLAAAPAERDFPARSGDDHYILYTGGTTGLPKGVVWRQEDIFFAALGGGNPGGAPITRPEDIGPGAQTNRAQRVGPFLPPGDPGPEQYVALALGPLMHASGQWSALGALLGGGTAVLYDLPHMDYDVVLQLIAGEHIAALNVVGDTSARPLLDTFEARPNGYDVSSLRLLGSGGSILSHDVKERLLNAFPRLLAIVEGMGSSEVPAQAVAVTTRAGTPLPTLSFAPKAETAVLDDALQPITPGSGEIGRLATRGRLPLRYHNDEEKTASTFVEVDGVRWSLPGDMATVDADGTIRVLGRGSLCINTGGEKVYPEEVEAVLKSMTAIDDAIVIGAPDERYGQQVVAIVATRAGADAPTVDDLREHCRDRLAGYKAPRAVLVVAEVHRSPSGKADYEWARQIVAERFAPA
jgi:acyl-CoA synthetase (AMP-forming)/AMP-acid ligase II